jgi:hypothetical protein
VTTLTVMTKMHALTTAATKQLENAAMLQETVMTTMHALTTAATKLKDVSTPPNLVMTTMHAQLTAVMLLDVSTNHWSAMTTTYVPRILVPQEYVSSPQLI